MVSGSEPKSSSNRSCMLTSCRSAHCVCVCVDILVLVLASLIEQLQQGASCNLAIDHQEQAAISTHLL